MDLEDRVDKLTKETSALRKELLLMKALMKQQNTMIKDLMERRQHAVRVTSFGERFEIDLRFPILSQEDLDKIESSINDSNIDQMALEVQRLIAPDGIVKHFRRIMSLELILEYNLEGIHNKGRLYNYPKLLDVLFKASRKPNYSHTKFLDDLRMALRRAKRTHFKEKSYRKKKEEQNAIQYSDDSETNS